MAKRRKSYRRSFSKAKRRISRGFNRNKALIGGVGYAVLEPTIDSFTSQIPFGNIGSDELIKVAIGYYGAKKSGMVGDVAKSMLYINAYKLAQGKFNLLGAVGGSQATAIQGGGANF